jgi:hypothetical protein
MEAMKLVFFGWQMNQFARATSNLRRRPYNVLAVSTDVDRPADAEWEMSISPVPREMTARVRELLINDGFPRLESWLLSTATPQRGDVPPYRRFTVLYDESSDALAFDIR